MTHTVEITGIENQNLYLALLELKQHIEDGTLIRGALEITVDGEFHKTYFTNNR